MAITSRREAMLHEEAGRVHVFSWLVLILALFALVMMPLLRGDPIARLIGIGSLSAVLVGYGWLLWTSRKPASFDVRTAGITFVLLSLTCPGTAYYFGVFSPISAVLGIALYVFALGSCLRYTLCAYLSMAGGQALLFALLAGHTIADRGLIRADGLDVWQRIALHLCIQLLLLIALLLGRMGRRRTVKAVSDLEAAVRELAHRDALLCEAKLALANVEKEGPGPFTGQIIGSFRLHDLIGRGAMGEIYEAEHVMTGDIAAVKLLRGALLGSLGKRTRFVREVRVAASLCAPNLVKVLEVADVDAPLPYLAMERLHGQDLWHLLHEQTRLPIEDVLVLVEQVSAALEVMKAAGIVHRDLKPQNLFLTGNDDEPLWKVLDFGVSKLCDEQSSLTRGEVIGTPAYMAPEQARGKDVDHRTDLYGLAVIVYRCLAGRPAFTGVEIPHVLYQVVHEMPVRPSELALVEPDVDDVLAIAMAKRPDDRFDSVGEFALRLAEAARGQLPEHVRERAATLIARQPWSH